MNNIPKNIYSYIIKSFLTKFLIVAASIALLIFIINLIDILDQLNNNKDTISWLIPFQIAILQVPAFLEDISIFMVMLAAMIVLFNFSAKSEITIMRSSGLSLWQILFPLIATSFILGLFFILIFNPLTITAVKKFHIMEQKFIKIKETTNILAPEDGIWLRQQNILKKNEAIIIRAKKIDKNNLHLSDVNLWFFNNQGAFYKKIDAKNIFLKNHYWQLETVVINDQFNINKNIDELQILTNLESEFITKKIVNNFEDVKLFSIFSLPALITDLEESGFSPRKFKVYYYSLLTQPFMFISMVLMAAFFSINNIRNKNNILYIIIGIIFGLIFYIGSSIIAAFGSSGLIPPFIATWIVTIVFLAATILLVFKKEVI